MIKIYISILMIIYLSSCGTARNATVHQQSPKDLTVPISIKNDNSKEIEYIFKITIYDKALASSGLYDCIINIPADFPIHEECVGLILVDDQKQIQAKTQAASTNVFEKMRFVEFHIMERFLLNSYITFIAATTPERSNPYFVTLTLGDYYRLAKDPGGKARVIPIRNP
jgi:hypothetical protein